MLEQPDQRGVGPVQIVDRQHDWALVGAKFEYACDGAVDGGSRRGGLELVDRGGIAEEMYEDVDHPVELGLVTVRDQLHRAGAADLANLIDRQRWIEVEISRQRVGDRIPDVCFTVRQARTLEHR